MENIVSFEKARGRLSSLVKKPGNEAGAAEEMAKFLEKIVSAEQSLGEQVLPQKLTNLVFLSGLAASDKYKAIATASRATNRGSNTYKDYAARAGKLPDEEIRGQLDAAGDSLIISHPAWYTALHDELVARLARR